MARVKSKNPNTLSISLTSVFRRSYFCASSSHAFCTSGCRAHSVRENLKLTDPLGPNPRGGSFGNCIVKNCAFSLVSGPVHGMLNRAATLGQVLPQVNAQSSAALKIWFFARSVRAIYSERYPFIWALDMVWVVSHAFKSLGYSKGRFRYF